MRQKAKTQTRNAVPFQMWLPPKIAERLKQRAEEESLPAAALVRRLILFELDRPSSRVREAKRESLATN